MKLRMLAIALDTVILLLRWLDVACLALWHAHNAALPRRAEDGEQVRHSVEMDYEVMKQ
jgi:hypothetical protein